MRVISSNITRTYCARNGGSTPSSFGHVVETVHVADALVVGLALGQLLRRAVQQPDVRVGTLDDLAVHLQHQPQHAVRRGMLGAEVQGEVLNLRHRAAAAGSEPPWSRSPRWSSSCRITFGTSVLGSMDTGSYTTRRRAGS